MNLYLLEEFTRADLSYHTQNQFSLYKALSAADLNALEQTLNALFASIPNDWYRKNQLANYEGYYASIVYSSFCALGLTVIAEDSTHHGQIDLTVMLNNRVFIIEFKVIDENTRQGSALQQIKTRNYQQKYEGCGKDIFLIGMEFDRQQHNLVFFESEAL